jgi:preprotein translocase subunit SecE
MVPAATARKRSYLIVANSTGGVQGAVTTRFVQPIMQYLRDTRAELRKVTWPTRKEAWNLTLIVLGATASMAAILGLADVGFSDTMAALVLHTWTGYLAACVVVAAGVAAWYFIREE